MTSKSNASKLKAKYVGVINFLIYKIDIIIKANKEQYVSEL